ncbi:MAG TPA: hypothetical protein VFW57_12985, partial [Acidimicrobiia bacterium]|nr:hypothetical protein [Acidimicrobiia bacterium]
MRTIRTASVMVALLLSWSAPPAMASEGNAEPDWLDVTMTTQGILEPMPDRAAPTIRQAHGTVVGNFEDEPWTWRASGAGSCTEIVIDLMAVYPPRPGDWASA